MNFKTSTAILLITLFTAQNAEAGPRGDHYQRGKGLAQRGDQMADRRVDRRQDHRQHERRADRRDDRFDHRLDRRRDYREDRWENYVKFRVGMRLLTLPARYHAMTVASQTYYYADGVYLIRRGNEYVVVSAPLGARLTVLPYGFRSFWIGPRRFFAFNSIYYVYEAGTKEYVVVEKPEGAETADIATPELVIYPNADQSNEQLTQDRYDCHVWSIEETGFDPIAQHSEATTGADHYNRAMKACLAGKNYSVS